MTYRIALVALAVAASAGAASAATFYSVGLNGNLVRIDSTAQTATVVAPVRAGPQVIDFLADCDFNASGQLVALRQGSDGSTFPPLPLNQAFRVNTTTGASVLTADFGFNPFLNALAFNRSSGQFVSVNLQNGNLGTVDVNTGAFSSLQGVSHGLPGSFRVGALAYSPSGDLYGVWDAGIAFIGTFDYRLVRFDQNTGLGTIIGPIGAPNVDFFESLRFDSAGNAYTINQANGGFYSVNLTTGAGTLLFTDPDLINATGLAFIPTPGAATFLGLTAVTAMRRRRR